MLVLNRRVNEAIVFGDVLRVQVVRILDKDVGLIVHDVQEQTERPMLLRVGDTENLGSEIHLTLMDVATDRPQKMARLGMDAPRTMPIYREELLPVER